LNHKLLKYCIIPAGGLGTRWSPVTNYIPKAMIPLIDRPTIDWIVKEAIDSGCSEIILVIDKGKQLVKKHLLSTKRFTKRANLRFIYKSRIRGVAEVMYLAKRIVKDNYFSMIVSDHPCFYKTAPLRQMARKFNRHINSSDNVCLLGFAKYPKYNNQYYGECLLKKWKDLYQIHHLCPRAKNPNKVHHPGSKLRIAGRYIISPKLFPIIKECLNTKKTGDLSDWDIFPLANKKGMIYSAMEIKSYFLDMGTPETYGQATQFLLKKGKDFYGSKRSF